LTTPRIVSRGLVYNRDSEKLLQDMENYILEIVNEGENSATLNSRLRETLARLIYDAVGRRPMILPVVIEV